MKTYLITFVIIELLIFLYMIYEWITYKPVFGKDSSMWKEGGNIVFWLATASNIFLSFLISITILLLNFLER